MRVGAPADVRVGRSSLVCTWRAPTQLRGTSESQQGERGLGRPQGLPKHGTGRLEEPAADIAKKAILHIAQISKNITSENRNQ